MQDSTTFDVRFLVDVCVGVGFKVSAAWGQKTAARMSKVFDHNNHLTPTNIRGHGRHLSDAAKFKMANNKGNTSGCTRTPLR